jgi:hypothetical protein
LDILPDHGTTASSRHGRYRFLTPFIPLHRFHVEANKMANGGSIGPEDLYGMVELDANGNVISASW